MRAKSALRRSRVLLTRLLTEFSIFLYIIQLYMCSSPVTNMSKVEQPCAISSRSRPPIQNTKFFPPKPYNQNLRISPSPVESLDTWCDLFVRFMYFATHSIRRTSVTTESYTSRNLETVYRTFSSKKYSYFV